MRQSRSWVAAAVLSRTKEYLEKVESWNKRIDETIRSDIWNNKKRHCRMLMRGKSAYYTALNVIDSRGCNGYDADVFVTTAFDEDDLNFKPQLRRCGDMASASR